MVTFLNSTFPPFVTKEGQQNRARQDIRFQVELSGVPGEIGGFDRLSSPIDPEFVLDLLF